MTKDVRMTLVECHETMLLGLMQSAIADRKRLGHWHPIGLARLSAQLEAYREEAGREKKRCRQIGVRVTDGKAGIN